MEKQVFSNADHQVAQLSDNDISGTPYNTTSTYNGKPPSTTSLNLITTPPRSRIAEANLFTMEDSHEIKPATSTTDLSKPISFISPRISSPIVESETMLPPMTPKTHVDRTDLSPSPTLFSPKLNRSLPPSLPLDRSQLSDDDDYDDGNFYDHELSCRPISNGFQTRLNCALMNLQHGYFDNPLTDFEDCSYPQGKHYRDDCDHPSPAPFSESLMSTDKKVRYDVFSVSPKNNRSPKQTITQKKRC